MSELKFKCPECGSNNLEIQFLKVSLLKDGNIDYDNVPINSAEVDHYQCENCEYILNDECGIIVSSPEKLYKWLKISQEEKK